MNRVSVTLLDNWGNGGKDFTRTVPFDNLEAVMSKAEVDEARAAGRLHASDGGRGFFLTDEPPPAPRSKPEADPRGEKFEALADALAAGVKVVSAPQLFPTPPEIARRVVALAEIGPRMRVLEPSAGTGNLLAAIGSGLDTVAVEINPRGHRGYPDLTHSADCDTPG